jgi:uncharacterized glyoxalase superfamily protein PhnB
MKGQAMKKIISSVLKITAISVLAICLQDSVAVDKNGTDSTNLFTRDKEARTMYKKLTTNMMVENMNDTVDFYSNVLGFEFVMGVPENSQKSVMGRQKGQTLGFALMKRGAVEMMFQAKKSMREEIPGFRGMGVGASLTFYIDVDNVTALYKELRDKVTIIRDMQTTFYGKQEFYIRDCNGYVLTFAGDV